MTLRLRLFLLIGGLLVATLAAGGWWVRSLTADLGEELGEVALWVGRAVFETISHDDGLAAVPDGGSPRPTVVDRKVRVMAFHGDGREDPSALAERLDAGLGRPVLETLTPGDGQLATGHHYEVRCEGEDRVERRLEALGSADERLFVVNLDRVADDMFLKFESDAVQGSIPVPRQGVDRSLQRFSQRFLLGSLGLLSLGLVGAAVVSHRVTAPLRRLGEAARAVGGGAFGITVESPERGEVGAAIEAFNAMSARLEELDEAARRLRQRQHLTELGEVARGLAHSLRNPLNALGLSLEELARQASTGDAEALAAAGRRQIRRVDQALRSFLALASQGAGLVEEVDLVALSRDVALEALQDAQGRVGIDVVEPHGAIAVRGVAPELRAVLQALVVNAVEASPPGGRVELAWSVERGLRALEVRDEGAGVAPEIRERLFTPHVTTKASGSGMGLYLAHRIATHRYRGSLALFDRPDGGTVARLLLGSQREEHDEVAGDGGTSLEGGEG